MIQLTDHCGRELLTAIDSAADLLSRCIGYLSVCKGVSSEEIRDAALAVRERLNAQHRLLARVGLLQDPGIVAERDALVDALDQVQQDLSYLKRHPETGADHVGSALWVAEEALAIPDKLRTVDRDLNLLPDWRLADVLEKAGD